MRYDGDYVTPLASGVRDLDAVWASAHLSFNAISTPAGPEQVGFLLPPRQTSEGVDVAIENIGELARGLDVPFAFETGVNYLKPRADELSDGQFFGRVAEGADCGILLDLHNLWANELNGRQPVREVLAELPLERVWEMHLAGGMMLDGYYLDAHSGAIADELLDLASEVISDMPSLGAIMFEVMPGYVADLGLDGIREQLARINVLWRLPRTMRVVAPHAGLARVAGVDSAGVESWERTFGALAAGHDLTDLGEDDANLAELARDPAITLFRRLIDEGRSGQISRAMHFTTIVMLASWGPDAVHALLDQYSREVYPDTFAGGEADRFGHFLRQRMDRLPRTPYLEEVLSFEHALVRAALYGEPATVRWTIDPTELFELLERGVIPASVTEHSFAMEIRPE